MKRDQYNLLLNKFAMFTIVVIGDVMLDKYICGDVERISPEAPVPVLKVREERFAPGGAANVAVNCATLSAKVHLFGVTGADEEGDQLRNTLTQYQIDTGGILTDPSRHTIRKTRFISLNQQLLRVDHENNADVESHLENELINRIDQISDVKAVIVSDYAKGTITAELMNKLKEFVKKRKILLLIDPKPRHRDWYEKVSLITPNKKEAQAMSGIELTAEEDFFRCGQILMDRLETDVVITAGDQGMYVFKIDREPHHIRTTAKEVYDVSGAGDTTVAALALALCAGAELPEAAELANLAAGIKVGKVGTAPVYLAELKASI